MHDSCRTLRFGAPGSQAWRTLDGVPPLVWTDRRAALGAACLFAWVGSVELGTSRQASRLAAGIAEPGEPGETVVDTSTGRLFDAAAAVTIVGGTLASVALPRATIGARRSAYLVGVSVVAGSGWLSAVARRHLGRFHRDALTVHDDHELVQTGPYRCIRHPLYAATIGVFVGVGAVLGNWVSLALAGLPTSALFRRIAVEEQMLVEALGPEYEGYQRHTAHLIPGIW